MLSSFFQWRTRCHNLKPSLRRQRWNPTLVPAFRSNLFPLRKTSFKLSRAYTGCLIAFRGGGVPFCKIMVDPDSARILEISKCLHWRVLRTVYTTGPYLGTEDMSLVKSCDFLAITRWKSGDVGSTTNTMLWTCLCLPLLKLHCPSVQQINQASCFQDGRWIQKQPFSRCSSSVCGMRLFGQGEKYLC